MPKIDICEIEIIFQFSFSQETDTWNSTAQKIKTVSDVGNLIF